MHSIQEVSRHRQQESESRLNSTTSASLIPDTNSSTSAFDGEISLTQQLQTINDLSPTFSVESGFSETPKHSFKFVVPVKETPQLRLDLPLPSSIHSAPCSRSFVQESTDSSSSTKPSLEVTVKTLPKPMLGSSAVSHATALLQLSDLPPPKEASPKETEESSCLDNVLDSSELEEVQKIEAQIQQETQFDDVSEEDLDLIRVADGRDGRMG